MIEKYDVEVETTSTGGSISGTVTLLGHDHRVLIHGSGREMFVEIDGKPCDEQFREMFEEWDEPFEVAQKALNETTEPFEIESWTARVLDGKVTRLVTRDEDEE